MDSPLAEIFYSLDAWQMFAVGIKAMTYAATFFAAGGVLFGVIFSRQLEARVQTSIQTGVYRGAWLALVFSVLRLLVMNGMLGGAWQSMFDVELTRTVLLSREGAATGMRVLGMVLMLAGFRHRRSAWVTGLALLGALIAIASFGWVGHASDVQSWGVLAQLLITVHLLAVAYWLGALWPLHHLVAHRIVSVDEGQRSATIVARFGHIALFVVAGLVLAGVVLLGLLLGSVEALWHSAYGQMVLAKLLMVAVLLAAAAYNKLRLTPRLLRGERSALQQLRWSLRVEMILACVILTITAAFTTLTGPTFVILERSEGSQVVAVRGLFSIIESPETLPLRQAQRQG